MGDHGRVHRRDGISLLVKNLPLDVTPDDVREKFEKYGVVKDVYLPKDYYSGRPRGFGFVQLEDPRDAEDAIVGLDNSIIGGREVMVMHSKESRKTPREMIRREEPSRGPAPRDDRNSRRSRSRSPRRRHSRSPPPRRRSSRSPPPRRPRSPLPRGGRDSRTPPPRRRRSRSPAPRRSSRSPPPRRSSRSPPPRRYSRSPPPRRSSRTPPPRRSERSRSRHRERSIELRRSASLSPPPPQHSPCSPPRLSVSPRRSISLSPRRLPADP